MTKGTSRKSDEAAQAGAQAGQDPESVRDLARRLEDPPPDHDDWGFAGPEPEKPAENRDGTEPTG